MFSIPILFILHQGVFYTIPYGVLYHSVSQPTIFTRIFAFRQCASALNSRLRIISRYGFGSRQCCDISILTLFGNLILTCYGCDNTHNLYGGLPCGLEYLGLEYPGVRVPGVKWYGGVRVLDYLASNGLDITSTRHLRP